MIEQKRSLDIFLNTTSWRLHHNIVLPYNEDQAQADPSARPKRPVSEAKRLANIANAGKAAAARSAAGRAAVAGNAVTHGQTCNNPTIFLPGENPEEYAEQVGR